MLKHLSENTNRVRVITCLFVIAVYMMLNADDHYGHVIDIEPTTGEHLRVEREYEQQCQKEAFERVQNGSTDSRDREEAHRYVHENMG